MPTMGIEPSTLQSLTWSKIASIAGSQQKTSNISQGQKNFFFFIEDITYFTITVHSVNLSSLKYKETIFLKQ